MSDELGFDPNTAVEESLGAKAPGEPVAQPNMRTSMAVAVGTKPDYQAELRRVAKATGVPVDTVAAYPEEMKAKATLGQFDFATYEKMFPASAAVLSDPEFAKIAHDDTQNLADTESVYGKFKKGYLGASTVAGIHDLLGAGAKILDTVNPFTTSEGDLAVLLKDKPEELARMRKESPGLFLSRFANEQTALADQVMQQLPDDVKQKYNTLKYATTDTGEAAYLSPTKVTGDAIRSLPTTAAMMVSIYLTRGAAARAEAQALANGATQLEARKQAIKAAGETMAKIGAGTEGAIGYAQQANQTRSEADKIEQDKLEKSPEYRRLVDAEGFTPDAARVFLSAKTAEQAGSTAGLVDAVTNLVGGKFFGEIIGEGGKLVSRTARGAATEGLTETIQSTGEQLGANVAVQENLDPTQSLTNGVGESAVQGLVVGGLTGGVMAAAGGRGAAKLEEQQKKAAKAEHEAQVVEELGKLAAESKLRGRDPESFSQFIEKAVENGDVKEIYVNPRDLSQSGVDVLGLAGVSPSVREQLQQALDTDSDIKIPLSEYVSRVAPSEFGQALLDHIKTDPQGMTRQQADEFKQNQEEQFKAEVEGVLREKADDEAFQASRKAVHEDVLRQLNEANRFSPDVNESYATLHSSFATVYGAKLGITPEEFYKQYYPQENRFVQAQGTTGDAKTLDLRQGDLLIQHNLTERNLLHARKLGGIPVPSLAITKKDAPLTNFGEITLLGSKDMADPRGYAGTKVFGADVYSPRYPTVEYQVGQKEVSRLDKELAPYSKKYGDGQLYAGSALKEGSRELERNTAVIAKFLEEEGITLEPIQDENGRPDRSANRRVLENRVRELKLGDELAAYAERLFETLNAKEKIFQGFTNSGNRRYIEHNLDNVVRLLKKELRGGEGFNYGVGSLRAKFTPQFKSIEQIRKAKNRLVDDASFKKIKEEVDSEFFALADTLKPYYGYDANSFRYYEEVINVLGDAAKQGLPRALGEYNFKEVPAELLRSAAEFLNKLRELPTEYFEAKILRDVSLSEFSGAVVPEGTSEEALRHLRDRGVTDIKTYKRGDDADRAAKIAEFENLFFQNTDNKRGSFNPSTSTITLLARADLSTFLHESGHFFLETLNRVAQEPNAPAEIKQDMDTTLKWFGVQGATAEERLAAWNAMDLEQQREHHEKFARGFESYLFEGRAPSLEMQGVFSRFRAWLLRVYSSLVNLNVEINDDVRGVFDRMLASSEQIKQAEAARNFEPMFKTAEEAGMTPEEYKEYVANGTDASVDAAHELEKRSLRDMKWLSNAKGAAIKKLQAEADAKRKAVRQEVSDQVMAEPVYRAREFLKRATLDGEKIEGAHKLYIPEVEALYKDNPALGAIKEKLGYGKYGMLANENGVHPDQVAEMFGFESGDALIRSLLQAEDPKAKIDALTDKVMLERYGDLIDEDAVQRAADRAIHNEARLRFVATEMAALTKQMGSIRELERLAKSAAESAIAQVKVRELNPNRYIAAGVRASKAAEKALKAGDRNEAIRQKRLQLFHVAMTREAMNARADAEKALLKFRKLFRKDKVLAKKYDMKLVSAARAVLGAYGIGGQVNAIQALSDLEKVKEYDPEMYTQLEPVMRMALQGAGDYATLPYGDFKGMLDAVNQIIHSAKRTKQVRIDGQLVNKKVVLDALRARMGEIGIPAATPGKTEAVTDAERRKWTLQGLVAAGRRVESWADSMDGGKFDGPFRKYIFQPISNAITHYRTEKNRVLKEYVALLREKQAEFRGGRIAAPEIEYTFDGKNELLGALLHIGNMSNKRKLLLGRGWATESLAPSGEKVLNTSRMDAFLDRMIKEGTLTESDFDFLQKVWDLMESIKGDAQKAHFDMYGHYFNEITADPVKTPFGEYRGGYAPAVADKEIVQDAAIKAEANAIEEGFNYMMPSTATGFTKSRVEYNRPLVMDLRLVASHIDQALRFTYVQPAVRDALRIIRSSSFANPMQKMDPTAITEMLMPWLHRSARQLATSPWTGWGGQAVDKFLRGLRKRTGMVAMTANFVNAFQQLTGVTMTALKVKPRYLKGSLIRYMKAPGDTADAIKALSPWMAERLDNDGFELRRAMDGILEDSTSWQKVKDISAKHSHFAQRAFQNVVDVVSWQAAFDQASESMPEKEAVQFADSVVRQTQGTQSPEDVARFESGNAFVQLFTQFTGYFGMQANLLGTEYRKAMRDMGGDKGRLAYVYAMGFMLPAVLADAIVRTFGWDWDDEDHDGYLDELFAWFFGSQVRSAAAMVPFAGTVVNATVNSLNNQPFDDRLSTSPSVSTIESSVRAPVSVYKAVEGKGKASKAIGDVLTLLTMVTGVPFTAVSRPLKYAADASQNKVKPANAADAARGAISGKGREAERVK